MENAVLSFPGTCCRYLLTWRVEHRSGYAAGVKRVLLTGMSGTGKSTLIGELAARGYKAIDTDSDEWSEWVPDIGDPESSGPTVEQDWVWREDRVQDLLATEDADVLFVSGCKSNQGKFYPQFGHIVLLSAPTPVLVERLATRTNNPYGKHPDELARILGHIQTVEPRLRRTATLEVDTSAPVDRVIETILRHVIS
ncbi:MAG TPA: AAA family ATPase [Chloroflexota bacterium]|nr:AAA family ATPase [Chloroflexota bacterium]